MFRLVTFTAALCFLALIGYLLSRPALNEEALAQTHKSILSQPFTCPAGTQEQLKRWHLDGYTRRCIDEKAQAQGPMIGWRSARKIVAGNYLNGVREGEWIWFGKEGDILRQEYYHKGIKTADSTSANNTK